MSSTPVNLQDILTFLDHTAPFSLAESWDNVGLMLGDPQAEVTGILIGLDPTTDLLKEAADLNSNLIITHHPLIFKPLKTIRTDRPTGRYISLAIKNNIATIGCHTNLDVIKNGVSQVLAEKIGLLDTSPLLSTSTEDHKIGFGRIGALDVPLARDIFLARLINIFNIPALKICGPIPKQISKVAVCGGSGSDLAEKALSSGADLYITGEVKHSTARWAEESGLCIVDAGHYSTENLVVEALADLLETTLVSKNISIPVHRTKKQKNPFIYYMNKN